MLKIGVVGAGHLGKIHIKCIKELKEYELVGFYDIDPEVSKEVSKQFGVKYFKNIFCSDTGLLLLNSDNVLLAHSFLFLSLFISSSSSS